MSAERRLHPVAWTLALLASTLWATEPVPADDLIVGPAGTVLQVHSGSYGDLFPAGGEASAEASVLALDVTLDGQTERLLVPQTGSRFPETAPSLFFEDQSGMAYLLWEGFLNEIHPLLYFTSFDGVGFGEVYEITGSPFSRKGHPQLMVTRDLAFTPEMGTVERLIAHVTWTEEFGTELQSRYAPLVFIDGEFVGSNPVRVLGASATGGSVPGALQEGFRVQAGPQGNSFLVGLVSGDHVESRMLEVVPHALSRLADHVAELVRAQPPGAEPVSLADLVRQAIFELDLGFHPASLEYIAAQVEELVLATADSGGLDFLAGTLHGTIIHIGMRLGTGGLASGEAAEIFGVRPEGERGPTHHLKMTSVGQWPVPEIDEEAQAALLFLSQDGSEALVAWDGKDDVYYRETQAGEWSDIQAIQIGGPLDRETIYGILERRALNR